MGGKMERIMRIVLVFAAVGCLLVGSANCALAQDRKKRTDSFQLEEKLAQRLLILYLSENDKSGYYTLSGKKSTTAKETAGKDAGSALEKIGLPAIGPLVDELKKRWNQTPRDVKNVKKIATLLGKFTQTLNSGQSSVKDDVRQAVIAVAVLARDGDTDRAAIETLGNIYAKRGPTW